MERKLLKRGNLKLSSRQGVWTLPRSTCIGAGICRNFCYAKKMERMRNVRESREWKLRETLSVDFTRHMIDEIMERKLEVVRIHESGDFYSQDYLDKWRTIANTLPNVRFYAFTKAFQLDFSKLPTNFTVIQSYGSCHDGLIDREKNTSRVVDSETMVNYGEYLCPYGKTWFYKCGETCAYCFSDYPKVKHVAFHKH